MAVELGTERSETPKSEFVAKLEARWSKGNFVCVGLDSDYTKLPEHLKNPLDIARSLSHFNFGIVEATHDLVSAYKPNVAFYESYGLEGWVALKQTIAHIKGKYPDIPVILDAKRADIGNTNNGYVRAAFDELKADAITVNPYFGQEALTPFLDRKDKGIIILVRTSNKGALEFQDKKLMLNQQEWEELMSGPARKISRDLDIWDRTHTISYATFMPFYQYVALRVANYWNVNGNCAVVVGATYPGELAEIRTLVGDIPILIPGIGAQGAEVEPTVQAGKDSKNQGMIINSSRGIIFASSGEDFAEAARRETQKLNDEINKYRLVA